LQQLKEKVSVQEFQFSSLVEHGRGLLESMDPGTEAEQYMDGKLSTLEQRWTELVSQVLFVTSKSISPRYNISEYTDYSHNTIGKRMDYSCNCTLAL
jgi:hypothetical protein